MRPSSSTRHAPREAGQRRSAGQQRATEAIASFVRNLGKLERVAAEHDGKRRGEARQG